MQVVQKKGSRSGAWVLIQSPVHQMQHSPADSPRPGSPGPEVRPFARRADGFAGPPSLCPAPPRRPLPQRPALPPTWRSARRGEGAAVSSHSPGPRGRDCTPNLPPPPHPGAWPPYSSSVLPAPGHRAHCSPVVAAATRGLLAAPQISRLPDWGLSPHPMTPPSVPPPGIAGMRRHRPGPSLLP